MTIKTGDRRFEERKRFDRLPEGYKIRRVQQIGPNTTRKLTDGATGALYEIASVTPQWTEWGEGHATSMWSGGCERRGYIEVAVPDKPGRGSYLYRATDSGVKLANRWRKLRGEPLLPEHEHDYGEWESAGALLRHTERRYCACGSFESRTIPKGDRDARGPDWPESLTTYQLHEAILVEPDLDRLDKLNAELMARLDADSRPALERVR